MRPLFGPRTVVEAAFLVAVPVIALEAGVSWYAIIGAGGIAYLIVLVVEGWIWREGNKRPSRPRLKPRTKLRTKPAASPAAAAVAPEPAVAVAVAGEAEHVRVLRTEEPDPQPPPQPEPVPLPEPEPDPAPLPAPEPEPVPEPPRLAPVPEPEPEPEPELPPAAAVIPIPVSTAPRQWNVWDLERLARENSGGDPIADEERTFLLMYLRDFAGADGLLPVDFDDLVRQSFGAIVANR